jgi:hypothetical protein
VGSVNLGCPKKSKDGRQRPNVYFFALFSREGTKKKQAMEAMAISEEADAVLVHSTAVKIMLNRRIVVRCRPSGDRMITRRTPR